MDIFFVISGLVMTISASRTAGRPHAARLFLRQRLTRIVPLYWLATTAKIAAVLALPMLVTRTQLDAFYVAGSYLLLPVRDWTGEFRPVLPVGWTLTYEMLFYMLVALALALRVPILRIALPALLVFAGVGLLDSGFANTIVLEFLYGVGIGLALRGNAPTLPLSGRRVIALSPARLPTTARIHVATILLLAGLAAILLVPVGSGALRPITWGLPAACVIAGAVVLEQRIGRALPAWLLAAGDASYAIYLTHGFVVPLVFRLVAGAGVPAAPSLVITLLASLLISLLVGHATFVLVERPMLHWFRRRPAAPPSP